MTKELKPCPFCGGEVYVSNEDCYGNVDDNYMVHCDECGLQFGFTNQFESEKEAIEAWNRRKPLEDIVEQLESFRKHEEEMHAYSSVYALNKAIEIVKSGGAV